MSGEGRVGLNVTHKNPGFVFQQAPLVLSMHHAFSVSLSAARKLKTHEKKRGLHHKARNYSKDAAGRVQFEERPLWVKMSALSQLFFNRLCHESRYCTRQHAARLPGVSLFQVKSQTPL